MDPDTLRVVSDWARYLLTGLVSGGVAVWASLGRRDRGLSERIDALSAHVAAIAEGQVPMARCAAQNGRIDVLDARLAATVTSDKLDTSITRAHQRMDLFESRIGRMEGLLKGIDRSLGRIEAHLLEHGPRAGDTQ